MNYFIRVNVGEFDLIIQNNCYYLSNFITQLQLCEFTSHNVL